MNGARAFVAMTFLMLGYATPGWAQSDDTRPATATFWGDTGLWFVPTGEVLPSGNFSASVYRTEFDFRQGNTNVSFWPVTGAVGVGRAELFGALRVITRVDRDTVPLLFAGPNDEAGGLVNEYPTVRDTWTGNELGDLFLGGKVNLLSQQRLNPLALAVRGTLKFPTADSEVGAGTGEYDGFMDLIGSSEVGGVELAGFGGFAWRGDPDDIRVSDGIRWGAGAGFPTRRSLRVTAEVHGEWTLDDEVIAPAGFIVGTDGSLSPAFSRVKDQVNASFGLSWQYAGVMLGAGINYRFGLETDADAGLPANDAGDAIGMEFRIGFHRGVRTYVPPPPAVAAAPPPAPPAPPAVQAPQAPAPVPNRPPTVRAVCDPCAVEVGQTANIRAETADPDGDTLTVRWSTTGGTLGDTRSAATTWRAEMAPGLAMLSVTVDDGRGGVATDTVTIEIKGDLEFEDVRFDFDSYLLRPDALSILQPVVAALKARPDLELLIEGHTCNIGTAEYNLALGERRATAVRNYLIQNGIAPERLSTITYGEERPAHDNAQENTRRLNRRAVLGVHALDEDSSR